MNLTNGVLRRLIFGGMVLLLAACNSVEVSEPPVGVTPTRSAVPPTLNIPPATRSSIDVPHVVSIYNENIPSTTVKPIVIGELFLMRDAVTLLTHTPWNGDKDTPLPLHVDDFDQNQLAGYIAAELSGDQELTIPADEEALYLSPNAVQEIQALILQARSEYLVYLKARQVLPAYLDEIDRNVLPGDAQRLVYHPENDPNAPPTATEALLVDQGSHKDYSRLQMNVYPVDIFNRVRMLRKAKILGEEPTEAAARLAYQRQLRDLGLRQLIYHEMTHVAQQAYINLHVPAEKRSRKSAWIDASHTLADVDQQYNWTWGQHEAFAPSNNKRASDESQAEGISYQVFVDVYDMSPQQKQAVWDQFFGRLENSRQVLNETRALFEKHYPQFSADEFGNLLKPVVAEYAAANGRRILTRLASRLTGLPAYIGYLNPMLPGDSEKFWAALRQD